MQDWAALPFHRLSNYIRDHGNLLYICTYSVENVHRLVIAEEIIQGLEEITETERDNEIRLKALAHYKEHAGFAQTEIDKGFPLLHAQAIVGLWGALEVTIIDFMVAWLSNVVGATQTDAFSKVKVPLSEFEILEKEERMRLLVDEVERSLRSQFKAGVTRFESLLATVGLSGPVDDTISKTLHEMFNVRNAIVHRASIVDRRLVEACPWLNYKIGDTIKVPKTDLDRYTEAVTKYSITVVKRVREYLASHEE